MPTGSLHILVVEDNRGDFILLQEQLDQVYTHTWHLHQARTLAQALTMCNEREFDLVLLDLGLPDSRGLETFQDMNGQDPSRPIVILSGQDDDELALKALQCGAQDYIQKGQFDGNLLYRAIRYAIERKRLEVKVKEKEEKYRLLMAIAPDSFKGRARPFKFKTILALWPDSKLIIRP